MSEGDATQDMNMGGDMMDGDNTEDPNAPKKDDTEDMEQAA